MQNYQRRRHLVVLLVSFVVGAVLFEFMGYQREYIVSLMQQSTPAEMAGEPVKADYMHYLVGSLTTSSLASGVTLLNHATQHLNIPFILVMILFFMDGLTIVELIGTVIVLPALIVCLYGMLSAPNGSRRGEFAKENVTNVAEVERVYCLHHAYLGEYEVPGKKVQSLNLKMNLLYLTGLIAILFVILYAESFMAVFAATMMYSILSFQLTKRRNMSMQPIISLPYDQCNPKVRTTTIFAYARKRKRRKNFPMPQHPAQCVIYLSDPYLAVNVLAANMQGKGNFISAYHSLMTYAYYQLGDHGTVKHHYDEREKAGTRVNNGPM